MSRCSDRRPQDPERGSHRIQGAGHKHGHAVIDWIADYRSRRESLPLMARTAPGEVRALLPAQAPEQAEPFEAVLADLDRAILPGLTLWQHPRFFGYFPAGGQYASILGDLVSTGLGVSASPGRPARH